MSLKDQTNNFMFVPFRHLLVQKRIVTPPMTGLYHTVELWRHGCVVRTICLNKLVLISNQRRRTY